MSSPSSPTRDRRIVLLLALNLVCLIVLIVRSFIDHSNGQRFNNLPPIAEDVASSPPEPKMELNKSGPILAPDSRPPTPRATATDRSLVRGENSRPNSELPTNLRTPAREAEAIVAPIVEVPVERTIAVPVVLYPTEGTEIRGWVELSGTPPPETSIDLGPACAALAHGPKTTRRYVVNSRHRLANVFVIVAVGVNNALTASPTVPISEPPTLDQIECQFEPFVLGLRATQRLRIRNLDPELHNVHATPRANLEFNFAQPIQGMVTEKSFPLPEDFIRIKCDIHPWMFAYICVSQHPYFSITDTNGEFRIPSGLPPGDYSLVATHQKAVESGKTIRVSPGQTSPVQFTLEVPNDLSRR